MSNFIKGQKVHLLKLKSLANSGFASEKKIKATESNGVIPSLQC